MKCDLRPSFLSFPLISLVNLFFYHLVILLYLRPSSSTLSSIQPTGSIEVVRLPKPASFYAIHGGPMAGRVNFQTASYQCVRPRELWQCNWLEETGTICSLVYDIPNKRISTLLAFSQGHWDYPQDAHGDKRNPVDFERWRALGTIGGPTDWFLLNEQADVLEVFKGKGDLEPISGEEKTM